MATVISTVSIALGWVTTPRPSTWSAILTLSRSFYYSTWSSFKDHAYVIIFNVFWFWHTYETFLSYPWLSRWLLPSLKTHQWRWFSRTIYMKNGHKGDNLEAWRAWTSHDRVADLPNWLLDYWHMLLGLAHSQGFYNPSWRLPSI